MKTLLPNQLGADTETEDAVPEGAATSCVADAGVTDLGTGIAEILNMRVGCWRPPVHLWTEPTAA